MHRSTPRLEAAARSKGALRSPVQVSLGANFSNQRVVLSVVGARKLTSGLGGAIQGAAAFYWDRDSNNRPRLERGDMQVLLDA